MIPDVLHMDDTQLEDLARALGGEPLIDQIHAEAVEHADLYPLVDGDELPDRAAAYRTVWRVRVLDAVHRQLADEAERGYDVDRITPAASRGYQAVLATGPDGHRQLTVTDRLPVRAVGNQPIVAIDRLKEGADPDAYLRVMGYERRSAWAPLQAENPAPGWSYSYALLLERDVPTDEDS